MRTWTHLYPNSHTILARKKIRKALDRQDFRHCLAIPRRAESSSILGPEAGVGGPSHRLPGNCRTNKEKPSSSQCLFWGAEEVSWKTIKSFPVLIHFFCKYFLLLSGFLRVNEDCLCHTCLENARMIIMIVIIIRKLCKKKKNLVVSNQDDVSQTVA